MKKIYLYLGIAMVIVVLLVLYCMSQLADSWQTSQHSTLRINNRNIRVELATSTASWIQGLSGRTGLEPNTGMLFVFDHQSDWTMWMKDMRFPLDIIWFSADKKITHIEQNLSPATYPQVYASPVPVLYVLEVPAGTVQNYGFTVGQPFDFIQ